MTVSPSEIFCRLSIVPLDMDNGTFNSSHTDVVEKDVVPASQHGGRGYRVWLSHGLIVTLPISYSLDGSTLWRLLRGMRKSRLYHAT